MLRKSIFCSLVLLAAAAPPLMAQSPSPAPKPSPSPSVAAKPAPGTRAFTEVAFQALKQARQDYHALCTTSKKLDEMDGAWIRHARAESALGKAIEAEAANTKQVREARDERDFQQRAYDRRQADPKTRLQDSIKAQEALEKAEAALNQAETAALQKVRASLDQDGETTSSLQRCPEHAALEKAKNDAERAEQEKREAERKKAEAQKQKTATGPAKKVDDCKNPGGLGGPLEKLACQEGK